VLTFSAILAASFLGVPLFAAAATETAMLIEMAADDAGAREAGRLSLAQALFTLAAARIPGYALGATGSNVAQRIRRLIEPPAGATAAHRSALRATRGAAPAATALTLLTMPAVLVIVSGCSVGQ
jgi:hypothetical protein